MTERSAVIHLALTVDMNERNGQRIKIEFVAVGDDHKLEYKAVFAAAKRLLSNLEVDLEECSCETNDRCPSHQLRDSVALHLSTH